MATLKEAAAQLGVSEKTVRRYIKSGKLPAILKKGPYGGEYEIPEEAITTAQTVVDVVRVERQSDPVQLGLAFAQAFQARDEAIRQELAEIRTRLDELLSRVPEPPVSLPSPSVQAPRPWWAFWRR